MKVGGSHHQRKRVSGVSGAGVWAWVLLVGRGMVWWAETSQSIVRNHLGDHPVVQSQSLHLGSHLHPDLLPLHCPVSKGGKQSISTESSRWEEESKLTMFNNDF